jgi:cytidylate kinase
MKRIIVIEREFGAGASAVAEDLAHRLGWKLLDHALTEEIAALAKVSTETCKHRMERVDPWLYRLAKVFWRGSHERSVALPDADVIDADRLICLSKEVIEKNAEAGNCVIVGRAAAYVLRERTDIFCVFLYAPREVKFKRVLAEVKSEAEALHLIDTVDEERRAFIRHYYNADWPARHLYHAMLNTAVGEQMTVQTILNLIAEANQRDAAAQQNPPR